MTFQAIVREAFRHIAIVRSRPLLLVVARLGVSRECSQLLQRDRAEDAQDARQPDRPDRPHPDTPAARGMGKQPHPGAGQSTRTTKPPRALGPRAYVENQSVGRGPNLFGTVLASSERPRD